MNKQRREATAVIQRIYDRADILTGYRLGEALAEAERGERAHRRAGRAGFGARYAGAVSVATAARLMVLRAFTAPAASRSFEHRVDFLVAYGAAVRAERRDPAGYLAFCAAHREAVEALDYAELVK